MKKTVLAMVIFIVWFIFLGFRLIDYASSVFSKGFKRTVCGADGCSNLAFVFSSGWIFALYIIIPLVIPIIFHFKKKK